MRLLVFVCLIVLASTGIGISGGVLLPKSSSKEDKVESVAELAESDERKVFSTEKDVI